MRFRHKKETSPFFRFCESKKKLVFVLTLFTAIAAMVLVMHRVEMGKKYIKDENGELAAVYHAQTDKRLSLPFRIEAKKGKNKCKEEVVLSLRGEAPRSGKERPEGTLSEEELLERTVAKAVKELEQSGEELVYLPKKLKDGTILTWKRERDYRIALLLFVEPAVLYFCYRSEREKEREAEKNKREGILRELPGFNNRLLLLLESGLIFHDAFISIANGYDRRANSGAFGELVCAMHRECRETGKSLTGILQQNAHMLKMREFSRIVNIISDNQYKGVNLTEKLRAESDLLWDQRKKLAQEKGRIAETKLTFPLALLLLTLVMVTAAPAVLQM